MQPPLETQSAPPATPASPTFNVDGVSAGHSDLPQRPPLTYTVSDPPALEGLSSPLRQHTRKPSAHREVKETLDARVEYTNDEVDGRTYHMVNQYTIMEEIGRGSYGAVHIATDQYGKEYAVKEFSKSRLRKRAQSQILRQGPRGPRRAVGKARADGKELTPQASSERPGEKVDPLFLIREEIAIMKKLNHPNLVQLIEVLDDPDEDSLYMVLEMCKKGVIMKVGLEDNADPYSDESCRCWFRDLILGIEYLHAQGVIHRDIKPDNLLVSEDDVLKVVDFGVSEMFEGSTSMRIAKSAGSPAFLPPELCGKHEDVSGEAVDIWSMGICLYCLKYGKIPFNKPTVLEMYEAVKGEAPKIPEDEDPTFKDLLLRILEKDPDKRIQMPELRDHPWVTKNGTDSLLSAEENCAHIIEPPNELELSRAFTRKMDHLFCVMKAIHRFKSLIPNRRSNTATPESQQESPGYFRGADLPDDFDPAEEKARAAEIEALLAQRQTVLSARRRTEDSQDTSDDNDEPGKGHAKDVSDAEPQLLRIGTHSHDKDAQDESTPHIVADSPTAVDFNIYDRAYEAAIKERLEANPSQRPVMYLTKLVKETDYFKKLENIVEGTIFSPDSIKEQMRDTRENLYSHFSSTSASTSKLAHIVGRIGLSDPVPLKDGEKHPADDKTLLEKMISFKKEMSGAAGEDAEAALADSKEEKGEKSGTTKEDVEAAPAESKEEKKE